MKTNIQNKIFPSMSSAEAKILQEKLSSKVITKNVFSSKIVKVCGVDVSYKGDIAHGAAVIFDKNKQEILQIVESKVKVSFPYIPGLFMLREARPILKTLKKLTKRFDLLLVDGNGKLHPRGCGLACYIGLILNKPVIGVAKSLLCGKVKRDHTVEYGGQILGYEINQDGKKIYVSIGNKISLKMAVKIVKSLSINGIHPEPLRLADSYSKMESKKWIIATDKFIAFLIKNHDHNTCRVKMEDSNYPGLFELTPFERWCLGELEKVARQFKKRFL